MRINLASEGNTKRSTRWIVSIQQIRLAMDRKETSCCVFLNLKKSIDTLDHESMLAKLECLGFRIIIVELPNAYLSDRKQYLHVDGLIRRANPSNAAYHKGHCSEPSCFAVY